MLSVLLNWCFIFITAFLTGFAALLPFGRLGYRVRRDTDVIVAGLAVLTVYAQAFSLFAGVGMAAALFLVLFCTGAAVLLRKRILEYGKRRKAEGWGLTPARAAAAVFLVLLFSYGTSRGFMHVDTDLYHAQAIRWIEEYGVVPGLGCLHSRFAYNSASFALSALFSMRWLFGEPMHTVQGFLALTVGIQCIAGLGKAGNGRRIRISDFLRLGAVYYLTVLFGEMVSPATDYFAMLLVFYVLIAWLDELEAGERHAAPYALLSLLLVFTATVKLSAAVMLLLVLKPAAMLIRERAWKQIGLYVGLGFLICLPWMARGVLISGWLFYPFTFVDLFPVDWKIEKGYADSDAKEIQVFARGLYDVNLYDTPFFEWAGDWFGRLRGMEKLWVASCVLGMAAGVVSLAAAGRAVLRKNKGNRDGLWEQVPGLPAGDWFLYGAVLAAGYLFWQFSAPLVRYGYAYVIALPAGMAGFWFCMAAGRGGRREGLCRRIFLLCMSVFLLYKAADLAGAVRETAAQPYYLRQQAYGTYEASVWELDGVSVYVPLDGGKIGYDAFPSSPRIQEIELRENGNLKAGFRPARSGK